MGWRRGNEFRRDRYELSIKCIIWLWYKGNLYMGSAFMLLFLDMVGLKLRINISICIFILVVGNLGSSWVSLQNNLVEYFLLWFVSVILSCWWLLCKCYKMFSTPPELHLFMVPVYMSLCPDCRLSRRGPNPQALQAAEWRLYIQSGSGSCRLGSLHYLIWRGMFLSLENVWLSFAYCLSTEEKSWHV